MENPTITLTMDRYTQVHMADELQGLSALPDFVPAAPETAAAERTGTDCGKSLVPSLVKMGGFDATTSDTGGIPLQISASAETSPAGSTPALPAIPSPSGPKVFGSGEGTRTPDTRIMIPLL
jgi:hypothetical protein